MPISLSSRSAAEACSSNFRSDTKVIELVNSYEQTNQQEFVMAFLDLYGGRKINIEKSSEFVHNYYVNTLNTREFCAALQQHRQTIAFVEFFRDIACVRTHQMMMKEVLQSFAKTSDEKLHPINAWKKASSVYFTAAAAICASVAAANANPKRPEVAASAAAASVVLGALGNWMHSLLTKHESAVIAVKDLNKIFESARRLQLDTKSMSEMVDDEVAVREKQAAFKKSFEKLQREDDGYRQDMSSARNSVLQSIIKSSN